MLRKKKKTRQTRRKKRSWLTLFAVELVSALLITVCVALLAAAYTILGLPDISSLRSYSPPTVTQVFDSDLNPIAYWYMERRWVVPRSRIPDRLLYAFLAAEDARFYEHPGVDLVGVIRAMVKNIEAGQIVQGASTITQQVTRSLLLSRERTFIRKIKEAILAYQIDSVLSKDEIITLYLNQIFLGEGSYGVEAAARTYFAKHVEELSLAECAILAGLPQAPSRYNPYRHFQRAKRRQAYVLRRMVEEGFITQTEAEQALKEKLTLKRERLDLPPVAQYFLAELKKDMISRYGRERVLTGGLNVITTLDRKWQEEAYKAVQRGVKEIIKRHSKDKVLPETLQAALVAMESHTGAIKAMVGGLDFKKSQYNLATQAKMQTGSAIKPIVYAAALAAGVVRPNSVLVDEPISFAGAEPDSRWEPDNFDNMFMGPITLRTALTYSRNVISVKVAKLVGLKRLKTLALALGIREELPDDLSVALGSCNIPLLQMVQAYSVFPNMGAVIRPSLILAVLDKDGRLLEKLDPEPDPVLDPVVAYQMLSMLEGVVQHGTGRCARKIGVPVGGKTGTTNDYKDAWFLGFTPDLVAGVWLGRMDRKSLGKLETGGRAACPVWASFVKRVLNHDGRLKASSFQIPDKIALVPIDKNTGQITTPAEGNYVWEALREDTLPPLSPGEDLHSIPGLIKGFGNYLFKQLKRLPSLPFGE